MIYLDHLLEATGGVLLHPGKYLSFAAFSHDTRQIAPGEMFVAVRGVRGNGHDYLLDAIHRGATGLLVEHKTFKALSEKLQALLASAEVTILLVEDTRLALQSYARAILERWHPTVIAIAGSIGKTSTKEAVANVLAHKFATFRSWQNYNNLLGIPLSLGRLEPQHEYAILELGCDHPGEIADLCQMVRPHIGVLTNISPVQLQYFGSFERLTAELGTLFTSLRDGGHFFYNQDDPTICTLLKHTHRSQAITITGHTLSQPSDNIAPSELTLEPLARLLATGWDGMQGILTTSITEYEAGRVKNEIQLTAHLLGEHHVHTMLFAYQIARSRGMQTEEIQQAMTQVYPMPGRLNPLPGIHHVRLLDDTHNASPASLLAGLKTLQMLTPPGGQRIAVLGDMLNLGDYAEEAHREAGRQAARYVDYLITRGELAALLAEEAHRAGLVSSRIITTSTHEDAAQAVRRILEHTNDRADHSEHTHVVLIKGSEEARMERVTEMLMARSWEASEKLVRQTPGWKKTVFRHADRPTWVEIDLNAIGSNTRHIKSLVGENVQVLVSLKGDAYGHGAIRVARTVLHNGASMLGVATVSEAEALRDAHITAPILVFGYIPLWQMREAVRLDITVTLYASEAAQALSRAALELEKTARVHVKVDTGMGRLGIRVEQMDEILELVREIVALPGLELEGLYTHLANADSSDQTYTQIQLERFQHVLHTLKQQSLHIPLIHAANSAATLTLPETHFAMVRPGLAIYGLDPSPDVGLPESFRPALSFKTQVAQVKWIPAGECIGYGCTYVTQRPTLLAILPVGYADGFRRAPYNWGSVLIHQQEAALLGRVCMDQCMVDVTHIPQTRVGDEVVLIGRQGEATLTAEQVAERLGTSNYEVISEILARVPRVD